MSMKPILFNTETVQAILNGRKTVTRRICKDANDYTVPMGDFIDNDKRTYAVQSFYDKKHEDPCSLAEVNMPICIGDILWVRETWNICNMNAEYNSITFIYRAGKYESETVNTVNVTSELFDKYDRSMAENNPEWRPSATMPKSAARIFLKVTDVRVERLRDITEEQTLKEGFIGIPCTHENAGEHGCTDCMNTGWLEPPQLEFMYTWDSTIKKADLNKYGWLANPYVFVIEFERCERPEEWEE